MDLRIKYKLCEPIEQSLCGNCNWISAITTVTDRLSMLGEKIEISIPNDCDGDTLLNTWESLRKVSFKNYRIDKLYFMSGVSQMENELKKNGPLCCCFTIDESFSNHFDSTPDMPYTIYDKINISKKKLNRGKTYLQPFYNDNIIHAAVIVGWDDNNWIVRNSWGKHWGKNGYFLMQKGINLCRIEEAAVGCSFKKNIGN